MGRPRKKAADMTTEEAMRKLFPKRALDQAKKAAEESKTKRPKPSKNQDNGPSSLCQVYNPERCQ